MEKVCEHYKTGESKDCYRACNDIVVQNNCN